MQKKNTLYTVNRWNKPLFAQGVDREKNILALGTPTFESINYKAPENFQELSSMAGADYKGLGSNIGVKAGGKSSFFSSKNFGADSLGGAALTTFAPMVGNALGSAFSGGRTSAAGNTVSSLGSMAGGVVGQFNPALGAAISAGSGVLGGLVNNLFGMSTNEELLKVANESIDANKNYTSNATSFDDVKDDIASMTSTDVYSGGLFSSGKAARKNRELRERMERAYDWAVRSQDNNLDNLVDDQVNLGLANYASYGGYLDNDYNVAGDYLTMKQKGNKQNNMNNLFVNTPSNMFDLGGDIQNHGADWSTGLSHIDAGGTHSENPYDGVQVGVDNEGTPNLVEEGETIYNDYVFSNRILADETTKKMFKLPRKKDISFAEISKKLEKEITERPNDAVSRAGFKAQMQQLEEQQERQKQEMEAAKAREAFEALSPEEQTAIMQQAAQQEAMAQQAVENQAIAEQQPEYQPSPEEVAAMQQQADGSEANLGQAVPEMAKGGRINRFDLGGELKKLIYSMLPDVHTDKDFEEFAKKNNLDASSINWEKALENEALKTAISKDNPALKDALSRGYDFGVFKPSSNNTSTYDWANFWTPVNEYSKQKGNADNKYRIDDSYKGNVKELEGKDEYKAFTDYILNNASDEERLNYFKWIDDNTGRSNKYIKEGKLRDDWKQAYEDARNDGLYGIQHYTPNMISSARSAQTKNYVIDENGNVEEILTDVPKEWTSAGKYSWATPENDITNNYYRRPSDPASKGASASSEDEREIEPVLLNDKYRYAGLFGPAVGLGMQIAGVGKPDYSRLDAAARSANNVSLADYQPIGDYLRFRPMDIWAEQNQLNAQSRATDRALRNITGPSRAAGIIANGYNSQLASGDLYRKSLEYNDAQRQKVADFNRGTNMFNAEAYNRTSQFNADARNRNRQASASLAMSAARDRLNGDSSWYNGIYGNIGQIFKGISDLGRENRETNWRNALVTSGAFGAMDSDALVDAGISRYKSKAKGGKIKKGKKGLTF